MSTPTATGDGGERGDGSRWQFQLAVDAAPTGMLMVDLRGMIVLVNERVEQLFGYSREALVGKPVEMLLPERLRAAHLGLRSAFLQSPEARTMGAGRDLYGLRCDGSEVPIEIGLNPLHTPDGTYVLSSIVDITERKRSAELFRLAIEASPTGMLMVNAQGSITLVNAQIEQLFGHPRHHMVGQPVEMLVPERLRARHSNQRMGFLFAPRARAMGAGRDLYGLRGDGSEVPIEIGLNPLRTSEGSFVLAAIVDITERKRAAERLADSLHEKETLLKEVHHRVKNNLQVISSLLNLQAHHVSDARTREAFAQTQARVHSIALVHELLYQAPDLSRISFTEYTRRLIQQLMHALAAESRGVLCFVDESDLRLSVDISIVCGLVVNELITNALKHGFVGRSAGRIDVSLLRRGDRLELCVRDDGVGLPDHIDFARVSSLGLDLVSTFARRLKAELRVVRQPGTSITLCFREP